jgi:hypothetical protein
MPHLPWRVSPDLLASQFSVHDARVLITPAHAFEQERPAILVIVYIEAERPHLDDEPARRSGASIDTKIPEPNRAPAAARASHVRHHVPLPPRSIVAAAFRNHF